MAKKKKTKGTPIYRMRHQEQSETINAMHPGRIFVERHTMYEVAYYADGKRQDQCRRVLSSLWYQTHRFTTFSIYRG